MIWPGFFSLALLYVIDYKRGRFLTSAVVSDLNQSMQPPTFFPIQKQQPFIPESTWIWFVRSCDVYEHRVRVMCVMQTSVLAALPHPSLLGPRPASGICGIFPSLYISTANLTNFSHVRQCRLCGFAERQTEQTVSESMNLWVMGNWEFPYGFWWNDKILSTGLWGGQNGEIIRYPRGTCHLLDNLIIHLSLCLVEWSFWIKWGEMDCPLNVNY